MPIQGSPERALSRAVFQDQGGALFLLEKFAPNKFEMRARVAGTLAYLNRNGFPLVICPEYIRSHTSELRKESLSFWGNAFFQITRFLPDSTALPRPGWLESRSVGKAMAKALISMYQAAAGIKHHIAFPVFSIVTYIYKLFEDMKIHHPASYARYLPMLEFLENEFMAGHQRLPAVFCHGDFHPLNVLWQGSDVMAVIDWEFTGIKPDCYDAANLIGCAGIEHPEGLAKPMVIEFLNTLRETQIVSPSGWRWLPEFVLALRFAWLCEWLRKQDEQMLETEAVYMEILIRHMEDLRDIWGIKK